jgi:NAD(P)-dependent dehydrogenase (short-subunit alcohol dehydrogenase family)
MNFENKTAIITGSSGIALSTAIALAKEGAQVHIAGIDEGHNAEAKTAAVKLPITVHKVDISYEAQVKLWIDSIASQSGGIDILINSAGIQTFGNIESTETADWDRVMNINLRSCILT